MNLKEKIDANLKAAMLAGDKSKVSTLRGLKSAILYVEVAKGTRETGGLSDPEIVDVLAKESKKRQESADLYAQGGNETRRDAELEEKALIDAYLPEQLSEEQLAGIVDSVIQELGTQGPQAMGQVIGKVKEKTAGQAEGSVIARLVKEKLAS